MGREEDNWVFVRARLSEEKRDRFKIACLYRKQNMDAVIVDLIDSWLTENDPFKEIKDKEEASGPAPTPPAEKPPTSKRQRKS